MKLRTYTRKLSCLYRFYFLFFWLSFIIQSGSVNGQEGPHPKSSSAWWYNVPATDFMQALPIGNGRLGAMVYGGIESEYIGLNHDRLWRRKYENKTVPVAQHLHQIRELAKAGNWKQAEEALLTTLQPVYREKGGKWKTGGQVNAYQPAGDLTLVFPRQRPISRYQRGLDLARATAWVDYWAGDVHYHRDCYSVEDPSLVVIHLTCNRPGGLSFDVGLMRGDSSATFERVRASAGGEVLVGKGIDPDCRVQVEAQASQVLLTGQFVEGVSWAMRTRVIAKGGQTRAIGKAVRVNGADEVWVLTAISVDVETNNTAAYCLAALEKGTLRLTSLGKQAEKDHRLYYDRVRLRLGPADRIAISIPTDKWLAQRKENPLPDLYERLFNYGRYLLISSSRPGDLPANLQGIWNEDYQPAWNSDYHFDINVQMNYWLAEVTNLSECAVPLFKLADQMLPKARQAAQDIYGCRGIIFPLSTDPYTGGAIFRGPWLAWTGAAPWMAQHYWEHWQFTGNRTFLKQKVYPFLKEVGLFYQDFMQPNGGLLFFFPALSPEQTVQRPDGSRGMVCATPTGDLALARETFSRLIKASELLKIDTAERATWEKMLRSLPPYSIRSDTTLMEFDAAFINANPQHRHLTHLHPLFPGDEIDHLRSTPENITAFRKALAERGMQATGWATIHRACCWARLGDGEKALACLTNFVKNQLTPNLFGLHDPWDGIAPRPRPFQIDCNFGVVAAIAEMLLQSHSADIHLLPALPAAWADGEVSGLRARGGFEVSASWQSGQVQWATLTSLSGESCSVRLAGPIRSIFDGQKKIRASVELHSSGNRYTFPTQKGHTYTIQ